LICGLKIDSFAAHHLTASIRSASDRGIHDKKRGRRLAGSALPRSSD
jgi:hypothetical protein